MLFEAIFEGAKYLPIKISVEFPVWALFDIVDFQIFYHLSFLMLITISQNI